MYEKEVDERKKLIDEELNKRKKAFDEQKKIYQELKKEQDNKDEVKEQQDILDELQKKIAEASKDKSSKGQANLKELLDKYNDELEKLNDIIEKQTDDKVEDLYDKESERLDKLAELEKERLEEAFSEDKIKQMVSEALKSGMFTDIDGNVKDLGEALVDYCNKFEDGMSAVGEVVKDELLTNLEIAKDSMKEMNTILEQMGLVNKATTTYGLGLDGIVNTTSSTDLANSLTTSNTQTTASLVDALNQAVSSNDTTINFNSPILSVNGSVSDFDKLQDLLKEAEKRITTSIIQNVR